MKIPSFLPALILCCYALIPSITSAQPYTPRMEPCPCVIKVDTALVSKCGYLVVPENRQKPQGRTIKIPFVSVRKREQDPNRNFLLYTTGGPGYSTTANFDSLTARMDFLQFGGFIAFDQRGSRRAQPCLDCPEVNEAIRRSYRDHLSKDSLVLQAVTHCRKRLTAQGIDLSAYNTIESAADINDLRKVLQLDSLYLFGISYSGGLMLTVAKNHPEAVKAMFLHSPLPGFVNYEEHALFNHNEALEQVFENCLKDSSNTELYGNLRERFHKYFTDINGRQFTIRYAPKGSKDSLTVTYTKDELLEALMNRFNRWGVKEVPFVMNEMIAGRHAGYVKEILDQKFEGNKSLSHGMRYSIYCSEQIAYASKDLVKQQEILLPWLANYNFNNVNHAICDCWKVKPEPPVVKQPVYSNVPALITAGDVDPWCRPFYNRLIKRTMPNGQSVTVHNNGHGPRMVVDGTDFIRMFFQQPYRKLVSNTPNAIVE